MANLSAPERVKERSLALDQLAGEVATFHKRHPNILERSKNYRAKVMSILSQPLGELWRDILGKLKKEGTDNRAAIDSAAHDLHSLKDRFLMLVPRKARAATVKVKKEASLAKRVNPRPRQHIHEEQQKALIEHESEVQVRKAERIEKGKDVLATKVRRAQRVDYRSAKKAARTVKIPSDTKGAIPDRCRTNKGVDFPAGTSQGNGRGDALSTPATKNLSLLPPVVDDGTANTAVPAEHDLGAEMEHYSNAPKWQRDHADKYMFLLDVTKGMTKSEIKVFCNSYNQQHPDSSTSYPSIMRARKAYEEEGIWGLFPNYGLNCATAEIDEELMTYFYSLYMKDGSPSAFSCWVKVLGKSGKPAKGFPSCHTFLRRLKQTIPAKAIRLARLGPKKWNRKDGPYIERDYSEVRPGQCWVSDHAQVDVGAFAKGEKPCFPWATVWRDLKSGKILSYFLHAEAPNSDHILQSFYYAALKYGLPEEIYIDNGKDYRCRDFAGGRISKIKVAFDESKASIVRNLGIIVHYALPYNAQSKPIERDFLTIKLWFSKHQLGYRGGNVVERPECLKDEIKNGELLPFARVEELMGLFIEEAFNNRASKRSKILRGRTPNLLWNEERTERRHVDKDALKLFCMRTSKPVRIGRNGIKDSKLGLHYWGEWMFGYEEPYVYMRRDPKAYETAWCFSVKDDKFLGIAPLSILNAAALAKSPVEREQLKEAIAEKRHIEKHYKQYLQYRDQGDPMDNLQNQIKGIAALNAAQGNDFEPKEPQVVRLSNTKMDDVIRQKKAMDEEGLYDMSLTAPTRPAEPEILLWDCDRKEEVRDDDD